MPTSLTNQGNITYNYTGAVASESANSNTVTTTLLDEYSISATKTVLNNDFRPGENITYTLLIENNGRGDLYNLQIVDDLGSSTSTKPLTFQNALLYINGVQTQITPTFSQDNSVIFQLPSPFSSGDIAIIVYNATAANNISLTSITNTEQVTANGGSATGTQVSVTPDPTATINAANYAQLSITKQSDKTTISSGDTLTYTFNITNSGNEPATNVILTDTLPADFTISQISLTSAGTTTIYQTGEYDIDPATNTLTLPNSTGPQITVPAATSAGAGTAVIQIIGTVTV